MQGVPSGPRHRHHSDKLRICKRGEPEEAAGSSHSTALSAAQCLSHRAQLGKQNLFLGFSTEAKRAGGKGDLLCAVKRPYHCRPGPLGRTQAMRSQRGEEERGLFPLPSGFLWVPSTSWLQPEASYPGRLWALPPACGSGE